MNGSSLLSIYNDNQSLINSLIWRVYHPWHFYLKHQVCYYLTLCKSSQYFFPLISLTEVLEYRKFFPIPPLSNGQRVNLTVCMLYLYFLRHRFLIIVFFVVVELVLWFYHLVSFLLADANIWIRFIFDTILFGEEIAYEN